MRLGLKFVIDMWPDLTIFVIPRKDLERSRDDRNPVYWKWEYSLATLYTSNLGTKERILTYVGKVLLATE